MRRNIRQPLLSRRFNKLLKSILLLVLLLALALPTPVFADLIVVPFPGYVDKEFEIDASTSSTPIPGNLDDCLTIVLHGVSEYSTDDSLVITSGPSHGYAFVDVRDMEGGTFSYYYHGYTPEYGYTGTDSITYSLHDVYHNLSEDYTYTFDIGPNDAPTNITLSSSSVAENQVINTSVGTLSSTDANEANSFEYSLVGGDTGSFNISGSSLRASASFDYETKSSYSVRVRSTDQGGLYYEETLPINVTNVNEAPTITSNGGGASAGVSVAENSTAVTTVTAADVDAGATQTYSISGGADSAKFAINPSSGVLTFISAPNFEDRADSGGNNIYDVTVQVWDGSLTDSQAIAVTVTNVNEAPTNITLSSASLLENQVVDTVVGALTTTDPDTGNTFTYTLVAGDGSDNNALFNILSANLRASASFDYELKNSYSVRIHSTDQGGLSTEKAFIISVSDAAENTTTSISSDSPDPSVTGQPYTVAVTVLPASGSGTPGGTVSVSDGTGGTCTVTLSGGSGSCPLTSTTTGSKTVTASYDGSASWNTSSGTTGHTVSIANSTTTFMGDTPDPSALDESVAFSARVDPTSPASGVPTGTVDFKEGSVVLCSGTLSSGIVACSYSALTTGDHTISAVYSGSTNFNTSTSASGTHTVELIELDDNKVSTSFTDVGNLSTSGGSAPYTYALAASGRLCDATNGAGNGSFEISGSTLQRKPASTAGTYAICVESTDNDSGSVQRTFSVIINNPPSLVSLSLDHQTVGVEQTHVGNLTPTDGQDPQVFTLETSGDVCTAENSIGNIFFSINGTALERNPGTPVGQYQVCVQVRDAENEIAQRSYTITVTGLPGGLALSKKTVSTSQTVVGSFSQSGGQAPYTYTLQTSGAVCTASNGANNGAFNISGANLERLPATGAGTYQVCAQGEDANGLPTQQNFTITVTAPPSNLQITSQSVTLQQVIVGTLSTTDGQRPFVYSLQNSGSTCNTTNGADNSQFAVEGNALKRLAGTAVGSYPVCLQIMDANDEVFQRSFLILVSDSGSVAVDTWEVSLTSNQVIDGDGPGTLAGTFTSTIKETTFALVDLAKFPLASDFTISGAELLLNATADYDLQPYYPLRILATEPGGQTQYLDVVIYVMKDGALYGAMAVGDTGGVFNNTTIRLDVVSNDVLSEGATYWASLQIVRYPLHGEAWIGSIIYQPNSGFVGSDSLTYRACDNLGFCVVGEVKFEISATIPATGFAPGVVTELPARSDTLHPQEIDGLSIEIPALGVQAPVVGVPIVNEGWDITWLGGDIGWMDGTAYPTWNGNSVLTGHLYNSDGMPGVFINLHTLKWGDQIIVKLAGCAAYLRSA